MRIEVLVDNEDPRIFPFNKPKLVVGSNEGCDIILGSGNVSRKHIVLMVEGDSYFVIDQGSTNGSFINEERLVPGRKVEWTSFFPLRLGGNILLSLLSDEDASDLGFSETLTQAPARDSSGTSPDATRAISLKDLQASKTEHLVKKRQATVVQRKTEVTAKKRPSTVAKDKKRMGMVQFFCVLLVGAAAYINFSKESDVVEETSEVAKVGEVVGAKPVEDPATVIQKAVIPKVAVDDLTPKTRFDSLITDIHCTTDVEKFLCDEYAKLNLKAIGTVQVGTMLHSFFDGQEYYDKAWGFFPAITPAEGLVPTDDEIQKYQDNLKYGAVLLFLHEAFPKEMNVDLIKDLNLTIVLKMKTMTPKILEGAKALEVRPSEIEYVGAVFVPTSIAAFQKALEPSYLDNARRYGPDSVAFLKEYFQFY